MSIQVHFNKVELSILTIPRPKLWIFANSILQLLYDSIGEHCPEEEEEEADAEEYKVTRRSDSDNRSDIDFNNDNDNDNDDADGPGLNDLKQSIESLNEIKSVESYDSDISGGRQVDNSSKSLDHDFQSALAQASSNHEESEESILHIALTPSECTIICPTRLVSKFFKSPLAICKALGYKDVQLLPSPFLSLIVDSDGSGDKSSRILELTKPLSEHDISIFYISSHFNDIVLIPHAAKEKVEQILTAEHFEYMESSDSYISNGGSFGNEGENIDDVVVVHEDYNNNDNESESITTEVLLSSSSPSPPPHQQQQQQKQPPRQPIHEKAFELFAQAGIHPKIHDQHELLLTGSRPGEMKSAILKTIKLLSLANHKSPPYFVLTRTFSTELSLTLPESEKTRSEYGFDSTNTIGSAQDVIIPISMDFTSLPLNCTGIVAGMANLLITEGGNSIELGYLSMARSGVIMIPQENLEAVQQILERI
ncbi:hypothetical protein PVL30_004484 [Lodderomyces elongisporus]|uniref:uncharacterized protein n=1 Tax=Lodderomyces elongisporus TaxID=36914 RepID=UPI0029268828|nr:uncharacterized protein PVL30_004484 [Lodderomyces elongisporus]WLF80697.1 hypothetical protein PVL30_004484 [Lodderomyces elongisporus]